MLLFTHPPIIHSSLHSHSSIFPFIYPPFYPPVNLFTYVCPPFNQSLNPPITSIHPSIHQPAILPSSISPSISQPSAIYRPILPSILCSMYSSILPVLPASLSCIHLSTHRSKLIHMRRFKRRNKNEGRTAEILPPRGHRGNGETSCSASCQKPANPFSCSPWGQAETTPKLIGMLFSLSVGLHF